MKTPEELLVDMGKRIATRRKKMELSQEDLAEKADVTPQMVSTAERGSKALRPENLLKISKVLGVSTDYLLTGDTTEKDVSLICEKLKSASPEQLRYIETIIDNCLHLCK